MRRGLKIGQTKPVTHHNTMSRELDWLVDQWNESSEEVKLQLVLAKIRAEEKEQPQPEHASV